MYIGFYIKSTCVKRSSGVYIVSALGSSLIVGASYYKAANVELWNDWAQQRRSIFRNTNPSEYESLPELQPVW
jgi:hypothetical protein